MKSPVLNPLWTPHASLITLHTAFRPSTIGVGLSDGGQISQAPVEVLPKELVHAPDEVHDFPHRGVMTEGQIALGKALSFMGLRGNEWEGWSVLSWALRSAVGCRLSVPAIRQWLGDRL